MVPSSVLGMLIFIGAEVMFFAGLISAFTISRAAPGVRGICRRPVLPAAVDGRQHGALVVGGARLWSGSRASTGTSPAAARTLLARPGFLGAAFVVLQGREWVGPDCGQGLTLWSSPLGAFFYLIVGTHAVHAIGALVALGMAWWRPRAAG